MAFASMSAEASKRMGGGKSVGQQSSNVSKKQSAPPAQATPPMATPAPSRPWGAMLGGLAAGLGLARLGLETSCDLGNLFLCLNYIVLYSLIFSRCQYYLANVF